MKRLSVGILLFLFASCLEAQTTMYFYKPEYTITNNKPVTTFDISIPYSGNYYISAWLMGVKHEDNSYSTYTMQVDNSYYTYSITNNSADWNFSNLVSIYIPQGNHQLHIYSNTLSDVPNVEMIYICSVPIPQSNASYLLMKSHNQTVFPIDQYNYEYQLTYYAVENSQDSPPIHYTGFRDKSIYYTFRRLVYFEEGDDMKISVTSSSSNTGNIVIDAFHVDNPTTGWSTGLYSAPTLTPILDTVAPMTGFYYIIVRTNNNNYWGTCNLNINNSAYFENVPVNCCNTFVTGVTYGNFQTSFALGTNGDPYVMLMYPQGGVLAYNDDFESESTFSDFNWGTDARIHFRHSSTYWVFTALSNSFPQSQYAATADIYTGIETHLTNQLTQIETNYPNYKVNDIMVSSTPSNYYNSLSWAFGDWTSPCIYEGDGLTLLNALEELDSYASIYGYTRNGANENNSEVDVYTKYSETEGDEVLSFASVKSKGHYFAAGYSWESKLGSDERVFHPRHSLEGGIAGQIAYHYIKDSQSIASRNNMLCDIRVIENASFNLSEYEIIENGILSIQPEIKESFDLLWTKCTEAGKWKPVIYLSEYEQWDYYPELLNLCKSYSELKYKIYQLVDKGYSLAIKLLYDIEKPLHESVLKKIQENTKKKRKDINGLPIICPIKTEALLFIKALFEKEGSFNVENNVNYSNAPIFELKQKYKEISIKFKIDVPSTISIKLFDATHNEIINIITDRLIDCGTTQESFTINKSGIYVVCLIVNGCVYEKKITINI